MSHAVLAVVVDRYLNGREVVGIPWASPVDLRMHTHAQTCCEYIHKLIYEYVYIYIYIYIYVYVHIYTYLYRYLEISTSISIYL